jgi:hypothetical protein
MAMNENSLIDKVRNNQLIRWKTKINRLKPAKV